MQKFKTGDKVYITDKLPPYKAHFTGGVQATVVGSYDDQFGADPDKEPIYELDIPGEGFVAWYDESLLTLVKGNK